MFIFKRHGTSLSYLCLYVYKSYRSPKITQYNASKQYETDVARDGYPKT